MKTVSVAFSLILLAAMSGCSSISSALFYQDPEDPTEWERKKLKGMPITLKTPTHVRVAVIRTQFMYLNDGQFT